MDAVKPVFVVMVTSILGATQITFHCLTAGVGDSVDARNLQKTWMITGIGEADVHRIVFRYV